MSQPTRVQRKSTKGWKMPAGTKCVTRPGPFGNPFRMSVRRVEDPEAPARSVENFRRWLENTPDGRTVAHRARTELKGFNLACFCRLDAPCHADVLLKIANE